MRYSAIVTMVLCATTVYASIDLTNILDQISEICQPLIRQLTQKSETCKPENFKSRFDMDVIRWSTPGGKGSQPDWGSKLHTRGTDAFHRILQCRETGPNDLSLNYTKMRDLTRKFIKNEDVANKAIACYNIVDQLGTNVVFTATFRCIMCFFGPCNAETDY